MGDHAVALGIVMVAPIDQLQAALNVTKNAEVTTRGAAIVGMRDTLCQHSIDVIKACMFFPVSRQPLC